MRHIQVVFSLTVSKPDHYNPYEYSDGMQGYDKVLSTLAQHHPDTSCDPASAGLPSA